MKKIIQILIITGVCVTQAQRYEHRITAADSYLGKKASVTLTIDDANGDKEITKPLIVAEGFLFVNVQEFRLFLTIFCLNTTM